MTGEQILEIRKHAIVVAQQQTVGLDIANGVHPQAVAAARLELERIAQEEPGIQPAINRAIQEEIQSSSQ